MPWGAAIAAVGAIGSSIVGRRGARDAARDALRGSEPRDVNIDLGFGNTRVGAEGVISQESNQFTDLSRLFAGQAGQQLTAAGTPTLDIGATGFNEQRIGNFNQRIDNQFGALSQAINTQPQFDPNQFAELQFDRLQSLASRGEEIGANRVANSLFSSGRLGANDTRTGQAFEGLARGQADARTMRALQATNMATTEASRLFGQNQIGVQNQMGLLGQQFSGQNQATGNFLQLQGFNQATQQQGLQNALGFGQGAGAVLDPNFATLTAGLNRQSTDQASRAGVAGSVAQIQAQGSQGTANAIGNAFAGVGQAVANR